MKPMQLRDRWVMVTGASSGLGRQIAIVLARDHGANVLPVARRKDRLEELKKELETSYQVKVEPIVADLSNLADVDRAILEATTGRTLYAAVLNAGVTHFGNFHDLAWKDFEMMLRTNVSAVVRMTTELVPKIEAAGEGGGILLVSSMAGITPVPYQTAYSGTKAFLIHFGAGMWHELKGRNVSITTYAPGGIVTEMTAGEDFESLRGWLMDVDAAAREAVDAFRKRKYIHIPGAANRMGAALIRFLPQRFVTGRMAATYRNALVASAAARKL